MSAPRHTLGPGLLTFGETEHALDVSCHARGVTLTPDKDAADSEVMLCGDTIPGAVVYTWTLAGVFVQDLTESGLVQYCWTNRGQQVPFQFTPNSEVGTTVTGQLVVDPLPVGGDEPGQHMTCDFAFGVVGDPQFTFGGASSAADPVDA